MSEIVQNGIITGTRLGFGENGFLDCWLQIEFDGTGQSFGGWALYLPKSWQHHTVESVGGHYLYRVMEIAGVTEWKDVVGRSIRTRGTHSKISAIGHIVKNDWFCPEDDFSVLRLKKEGGAK